MKRLIRHLYPLWLREKVYFRTRKTITSSSALPRCSLQFAPANLTHLLSTDLAHRQIADLGFYDRQLSKEISRMARKGGLLVDVGANVGYFTVLWAALNPRNEVYAFEPSPRNIRLLQKNVLEVTNPERITLFGSALGKEDGSSLFDPGPESETGWGGFSRRGSPGEVKVFVRRLDHIVPMDKIISVLKIDTEGADAWVLAGAEKLLKAKSIRTIFYEENLQRMSALGIDRDEAARFLRRLDYSVKRIGPSEFCAKPN